MSLTASSRLRFPTAIQRSILFPRLPALLYASALPIIPSLSPVQTSSYIYSFRSSGPLAGRSVSNTLFTKFPTTPIKVCRDSAGISSSFFYFRLFTPIVVISFSDTLMKSIKVLENIFLFIDFFFATRSSSSVSMVFLLKPWCGPPFFSLLAFGTVRANGPYFFRTK